MSKIYLLKPFFKFISELNLEKTVWTGIIRVVVLNVANIRTRSLPLG